MRLKFCASRLRLSLHVKEKELAASCLTSGAQARERPRPVSTLSRLEVAASVPPTPAGPPSTRLQRAPKPLRSRYPRGPAWRGRPGTATAEPHCSNPQRLPHAPPLAACGRPPHPRARRGWTRAPHREGVDPSTTQRAIVRGGGGEPVRAKGGSGGAGLPRRPAPRWTLRR